MNFLFIYQAYEKASKRPDLKATIRLLQNTSLLLANFKDNRPIRSMDDPRLAVNRECLQFFLDWHEQKGTSHATNFITRECFQDLKSMVVAFEKIVQTKLQYHPTSYVNPARVNTDVVENFFCSQRAINGCNTNPTTLQYAKGINTILISRKLVSTKSNAGGRVSVGGAMPYKVHAKKSFASLRI
jgi:hypothetical protein